MQIDVEQAIERDRKLGFERVERLHGSTFKENSTVIIVPTRGTLDHRVVTAWENMIAPMNQKRAKMYAVGHEVGIAYNAMIEQILAHPQLSKYKYVLTLEDDNLPPPDAHIRLLESIDLGPFAAVAGLYFTKGDWNMPMAFGDPKEFNEKGIMDMRPRDVVEASRTGSVVEVNGVAMGCTLWRMEIFRELRAPWFVTVNENPAADGTNFCSTQDLHFCDRIRRAGKRLAVDLRVHVGHIDVETGNVY